MKKTLLASFVIFYGCSNSDSEKMHLLEKKVDSLTIVANNRTMDGQNGGENVQPISAKDSLAGEKIRIEKEAAMKPLPKFASYIQLKRNLFSKGSTKEEILALLGRPDDIESSVVAIDGIGHGKCQKDTWYYKKMQITFHHGFAETIKNGESNPRCLYYYGKTWLDLLSSDIEIEKQWGEYLMDNTLRIENPYGIGLEKNH